MKSISFCTASALAMVALLGVAAPARSQVSIAADFASHENFPLVKSKFGVYNSGYVTPARWLRDAQLLRDLAPARVRWELMWGHEQPGWRPMVNGSANNLVYDFSQIDQVVDIINSAHALPVANLTYTPKPLQPPGGSWNSPPSNFDAWAKAILPAFAHHWKATGRRIGAYEILNEPDLTGEFWLGTQAQYLDIYGRAASALRLVDPDAYIEGPALCCVGWQAAFVDAVIKNKLPLDGFSFHRYGDLTGAEVNADYQNATDSGVKGAYGFSTIENNLNEYNYTHNFVVPTDLTNYRAAPELLRSFKAALEKPWITHIEWAQFQDPICPKTCDVIGLLDQNGHRRATYNAFYIYSHMPINRRQFTSSQPGIDGIASADTHKSAVVLWNTSAAATNVTVALKNVPFAVGNMRIYRIDATHASYGDNPANEMLTPVQSNLSVSTSGLDWSGAIPGQGVVYIEIEDGTGTNSLSPVRVANSIRSLNYSPAHSKLSYSSFDENLWSAELGMGPEQFAETATGVFANNIPASLRFRFAIHGTPTVIDVNSILGVRIDYQTAAGFTKSVLYHAGLYNLARSAPFPWGTRQSATTSTIKVASLADFTADVAALAPVGWNGNATIVFQMQNAGAGSSASVRISGTS